MKVSLRREDAHCLLVWSVGVNLIASGCGRSDHPHLLAILLDFRRFTLTSNPKLTDFFFVPITKLTFIGINICRS